MITKVVSRSQPRRRQMRSRKSDSAITAARLAGIQLRSYKHADIYSQLRENGIRWNSRAQRWEANAND